MTYQCFKCKYVFGPEEIPYDDRLAVALQRIAELEDDADRIASRAFEQAAKVAEAIRTDKNAPLLDRDSALALAAAAIRALIPATPTPTEEVK